MEQYCSEHKQTYIYVGNRYIIKRTDISERMVAAAIRAVCSMLHLLLSPKRIHMWPLPHGSWCRATAIGSGKCLAALRKERKHRWPNTTQPVSSKCRMEPVFFSFHTPMFHAFSDPLPLSMPLCIGNRSLCGFIVPPLSTLFWYSFSRPATNTFTWREAVDIFS